jgi:hypothetical protein
MKLAMKLFFTFILVLFVMGIALCLNPAVNKENMENMLSDEIPLERVPIENKSCPNLLIRSGSKLYLHNTAQPRSDTNPIGFDNLEGYLEYLQEQRKEGIRCPVLFLQEENNTQGQTVYRMRPGPNNMAGGFPTEPTEVADGSRDRPPFNQNQFAGFDPHGFHVGQYTELDQIHDSTSNAAAVSDNPMDTNWGGVEFSREAVESGKYEDRQVGKPSLVPKVVEIYK